MLSIFLKMLHCNYKMELLLIKELYNLKIWKLWSYGEPYDDLEMVEPMTFEERQSFDGRSKINDWIPRKVQKMDSNSNLVLGDYSGYLFSAMTKRAVNILLPLMKENVEVLPLKCEYGEYYLINIITVLNCIDYEHAKYKMFSDQKRIMRFETYSFFEDKINQTHIFKIIDEPVRKPFVSDTFKNAVEEAGLTGFRFELVWDSKQVVY